MQFDLISDFHVEMNHCVDGKPFHRSQANQTYPWGQEKKSKVLLVPGDCANSLELTKFVILEAKRFYQTVLFTDGNHEHYHGAKDKKTVGDHCQNLQEWSDQHSGIHYLNGTSYRHGNTLFVGANGWYDWKANPIYSREQQHWFWKTGMNDHREVRYDPDGYPDKLARRHTDMIGQEVAAVQDDPDIHDIVVFTHTIPHGFADLPVQHGLSYLNGSFRNTEMPRVLIEDHNRKIKVWCFGHTHFFYDQVENGVRFVTNPRGYMGERRDKEFPGIITLDTHDSLKSAFELSQNKVSYTSEGYSEDAPE